MRTAVTLLLVAAGCLAAGRAQASSLAQHSVEWYDAHEPEQAAELKLCVLHHGFLHDQDCGNANAAFLTHLYDETSAAHARGDWVKSMNIVNANPADYRCDEISLPNIIRICHSPRNSATPPLSWCAAADEAAREDGL